MSTLIDEIRADLLELKESYQRMLGYERQRLAHQAGYCRGRGWNELAAEMEAASMGDDLAEMMEKANALIHRTMERIMGVSDQCGVISEQCEDLPKGPVVGMVHFADGTTKEIYGKNEIPVRLLVERDGIGTKVKRLERKWAYQCGKVGIGVDEQPQEGWSKWIEDGEWFTAAIVSPDKYGAHSYAGGIGFCACGCYMGSCASSGPVDPFGACPKNQKDQTDLTNLTDLTDLSDDAKGGPAL